MAARASVVELQRLYDVSVTSPANGDVVTYDSATGKFKNAPPGGGGGAPSGPAGGDLAGTFPNPTIKTALNDPAAATPGLRTLGTGAAQAAAGNDVRLSDQRTPLDASVTTAKIAGGGLAPSSITGTAVITTDSRLSDSRTPLAHQATHIANGSDALPWTTIHGKGTAAARPAAGATNSGYTYFATDTDGGTLARSDGSVWTKLALALSEPAGGDLTGTLPSPSIAAGAVTSSKLATAVSDLLPTTGQKNALAGTNGTPGSGNPYVTNTDSRLTDARTPTAHASTHAGAGSDPLTSLGALSFTGTLTLSDVDVALGTTTGTKIGTATNQKLAFFNATPIIQQAQTVDLKTLLVNFGFMSSSAGATPLNLGAGAITGQSITLSGLTSGRVPFASTAGLITDSAGLTWDDTNKVFDAISSASGTTPELRAENTATSGTGLLRARGKTAGGVVTEGYIQSTAAAVNIGSASAHPAIFVANATELFRLNSGGNMLMADGKSIATGTTTGSMFGTTSSQKISVLGATPIVQQAQTVDLKTAFVNFGFMSSSAGATPLNLGGGLMTAAVGTGATFVVAATAASTRVKAQADYVCDGTADDVEIAAAIAALPAGGGTVLLSEGTFNLAAVVNVSSNVRIQGAGIGATIVKMTNSANLNGLFSNPDWTNGNGAMHVCYATLDGNKANQTGGQGFGIQWVKPFGGSGCSWVEAKNCRGDGVQFNGNGDPTISRLVFGDNLYCHDNASNGFKATFGMRNGVYTNIFTYNNGVDGIVCDASEDIFVNAYARNNTRHGIFIRNVFSSSHTALVATGNGRIGILAVDINSSQGANWRAQNNSQSSSGTYDDIVFAGNLGVIGSIVVDTGGSGYATPPTVTITDPHGLPLGSGAAATATVAGGVVTGVTVTLTGDLYSATVVPTIAFGGPGTGATAHAVVTPYSYGISKNSLVTGIVVGYEAQIGAGPTERYGIYVDDDLTGDFQIHGVTYGSTLTGDIRLPNSFGNFSFDDVKSGIDRSLGETRWHGTVISNSLGTNYERMALRYNSGSTRYEFLQESGGTGTARTLRVGTTGASTLELVTAGSPRLTLGAAGELGFFGVTPVARQARPTTLNGVINLLISYGLSA